LYELLLYGYPTLSSVIVASFYGSHLGIRSVVSLPHAGIDALGIQGDFRIPPSPQSFCPIATFACSPLCELYLCRNESVISYLALPACADPPGSLVSNFSLLHSVCCVWASYVFFLMCLFARQSTWVFLELSRRLLISFCSHDFSLTEIFTHVA